MGYRIRHERDICIGCAACTAICPKYWIMEQDGKATAIKTKIEDKKEDLELNKEAELICPVNCIHIEKDIE
jgi:ferredoxin